MSAVVFLSSVMYVNYLNIYLAHIDAEDNAVTPLTICCLSLYINSWPYHIVLTIGSHTGSF